MADSAQEACQALALAAGAMLDAAWSPIQVRHGEIDWTLACAYVLDVGAAIGQFAEEPQKIGVEMARLWVERASELVEREKGLRAKIMNKPRYGPIIVLASQIAVTLEYMAKLIATEAL